MQITSYLDRNFISIRETFPESLVKIRHVDVTWRHVTSFCHFGSRMGRKTADVSTKYPLWLHETYITECSYITAFIWGVKLFFPTFSSKVIVSWVRHPISAKIDKKLMTSSGKMLTSAEKSTFWWFFTSDRIKEVLNLYQGKFGTPERKNAKITKGGLLAPPPRVQQPPKSPCNVGLNTATKEINA